MSSVVLLRVAEFYNSDPQFITCSATIHNPEELAERIVGKKFVIIDRNGAPTAEKHVILYNPPIVNEALGIRRSSLSVSNKLAAEFLTHNITTIVFARMRRSVEVILTYLREHLAMIKRNPHLVVGYRGGYLPNERRSIEEGLRSGKLRGVISTNALELGIDVGSLDVAILCGYPERSPRCVSKSDAPDGAKVSRPRLWSPIPRPSISFSSVIPNTSLTGG